MFETKPRTLAIVAMLLLLLAACAREQERTAIPGPTGDARPETRTSTTERSSTPVPNTTGLPNVGALPEPTPPAQQ